MADGRFVTKRISCNEQLGRVSWQADLFFTKCIAHLDVEGRVTGNPVLLKSLVVPLRPEITIEAIPELIAELAAALGHEGEALVVPYEVNGQQVLYFPGFRRIQKGLRADREAASRLPPPPPAPDQRRRKSGVTPELLRSRSRGGPAQVQVEVQGEAQGEVQGQETASPAGDDSGTPDAPSRPAVSSPERPSGGWPAEFAAALEPIGQFPPGRVGRAIGPVVKRYGQDRAREMLAAFVQLGPHQRTDGKFDPEVQSHQFCTPERFARTAGFWAQQTEPITDTVQV
jgi:hypothetical protein